MCEVAQVGVGLQWQQLHVRALDGKRVPLTCHGWLAARSGRLSSGTSPVDKEHASL